MNEIGPKNVGTLDANQTYLVRPINDTSNIFQIQNYKKSVEQPIVEELNRFGNIGVFAANADTEKLYSAVKEDNEKKGGRQ